MDDYEQFRELLRERTRDRGALSRLSEQSDIAMSVISRWRAGVGRPSDTNLRKLAPALGVPYEDLARMCGYSDGAPSAVVNSELEARFMRLAKILSQYPRSVWLSVLEANERMVEFQVNANDAERPLSDPPEQQLSARTRTLKHVKRAADAGLVASLVPLVPKFALR